jgi:cation transport regulator ChaB
MAKQREEIPICALEYRLPLFSLGKRKINEGETFLFHNKLGSFSLARRTDEEFADDNPKIIRSCPSSDHRDILDAVFAMASDKYLDYEGRMHIEFDVRKIGKALGVAMDWQKMNERLLVLKQTIVTIWRPGRKTAAKTWPLIVEIEDTGKLIPRGKGRYDGKVKTIILDENYV